MDEFKPYNLCCALHELHARCMVCKRDFCVHCFSSFHVVKGWMKCDDVPLWWKNLNGRVIRGVEGHELHPYTGGRFLLLEDASKQKQK